MRQPGSPEQSTRRRTRREALVGVDIGSASTKAAVVDLDGSILATASVPTTIHQPAKGTAEYDPLELLGNACRAIASAIERASVAPGDVLGIATCGAVSGTLGIDETGRPTTPYTTTLDRRGEPWADRLRSAAGERLLHANGSDKATLAPKAAWIQTAFPDAYRRTRSFVTANAYVGMSLAGLPATSAYIDPTQLWMTGVANVRTRQWDDELCAAAGVDRGRLPEIVASIDVVGHVSPEIAEASGVLPGTLVVAGAGDQSAGFLAAGLRAPGQAVDVAGTYPTLAIASPAFNPTELADVTASVLPGLWHPLQFLIGGGLTHRWAVDLLSRGEDDAFGVLEQEASQIDPGSDGLLFLPYFGGRSVPPDGWPQGGWIGLTWTHTRGHMYRAVLEAIAFDRASALRRLSTYDDEAEPTEVVVCGGGARSALWNQIRADVLGVPYLRIDREDVASHGAALIAGVAVGVFESAEAAASTVGVAQRYEPDPAAHSRYRSLHPVFEDAVSANARVVSGLRPDG